MTPGRMRVGEVDRDAGGLRQLRVARHFLTLIICERRFHTRGLAIERAGEAVEGGLGGGIVHFDE